MEHRSRGMGCGQTRIFHSTSHVVLHNQRPSRSRHTSSQTMKVFKACVTCMENTMSLSLKNYGKVVYMGHRRFLPIRHHYHRWKRPFNGNTEIGVKPWRLNGME